MELQKELLRVGLWSDAVRKACEDGGFETPGELAHSYGTAKEVAEQFPALLDAWHHVQGERRASLGEVRAIFMLEVHKRRSAAALPQPTRLRRPRDRASRGKPKGVSLPDVRKVDDQTRRKAALEAVRLSETWAPAAGVFKGFAWKSDPLKDRVRTLAVDKLCKFEARGVLSALKLWGEWVTACLPDSPPEQGRLQALLLEEFIKAKVGASGPLTACNKLVWLQRHLGAPISLEGITRPPRQSAETGEVKELEQAVALPPELLSSLAHLAKGMIQDNTWDSVAVCVALSLAWSLMIFAHVNRSRITHYSEDVVWCRAFRGKARKAGARPPFRWVLVRKEPSGVDVGGHILQRWSHFSKATGKPLEYLCMDASSGVMLQYSHLTAIIQRLMKTLLPDPSESVKVSTYSFRRVGATLCGILRTSEQDQVDFGGWAGVPELAKGAQESASVMRAWRQSMPHLYCDRRSANEELQKLAHRDMVCELTSLSHQVYGAAVPMSWDQLEIAARHRHKSGGSMAEHIKSYVFERLAQRRAAATVQRAYGCLKELKSSFTLAAKPGVGKPAPGGDVLPAQALVKREPPNLRVGPEEPKASSSSDKRQPEVDLEDFRFFATLRGSVIHCQVPGTSWVKMCESRVSRQLRQPRKLADVLDFGGHSNALTQGRRFCAECLSRARAGPQ